MALINLIITIVAMYTLGRLLKYGIRHNYIHINMVIMIYIGIILYSIYHIIKSLPIRLGI